MYAIRSYYGGFMVFALARESRKEHFEQLGAVTFSHMKELEKLLGLQDQQASNTK